MGNPILAILGSMQQVRDAFNLLLKTPPPNNKDFSGHLLYGQNNPTPSFPCHRLMSTPYRNCGGPRQFHHMCHRAIGLSPNSNWQLEGAEVACTHRAVTHQRAVEGRSWEAPTRRRGTSEQTLGSSCKARGKPLALRILYGDCRLRAGWGDATSSWALAADSLASLRPIPTASANPLPQM